jgi:hypothetical protein
MHNPQLHVYHKPELMYMKLHMLNKRYMYIFVICMYNLTDLSYVYVYYIYKPLITQCIDACMRILYSIMMIHHIVVHIYADDDQKWA